MSDSITDNCKLEHKNVNKRIIEKIVFNKDLNELYYESVTVIELNCSKSWKWSLNDTISNNQIDKIGKTFYCPLKKNRLITNSGKSKFYKVFKLEYKSDGL